MQDKLPDKFQPRNIASNLQDTSQKVGNKVKKWASKLHKTAQYLSI